MLATRIIPALLTCDCAITLRKIMKITNKYGPNTTILLPGSCDAKCGFCFWNRAEAKIKPPNTYIDDVFHILENLPDKFVALSISGGEPTLSPIFMEFISKLTEYRRAHILQRVVLTTHGGHLTGKLASIARVVDHINISRHAIGTNKNRDVFKSNNIPSDDELLTLIQQIHSETLCDVTLNCVIQPDVSIEFCNKFIEYAKALGADAVSFRKIASDVTPTDAELAFSRKYPVVAESKCPVCRGKSQTVNGYDVRWKGSVLEPSIATNGVYEAVIHPDGKVYTDWGMKYPLELDKKVPKIAKRAKPLARTRMSYRGGGRAYCGTGFGGC